MTEAQGGTAAMGEWECIECGHIHEGENPPRRCPECGAASDRFEFYEFDEDEEELEDEEDFEELEDDQDWDEEDDL